MILVAGLAVAGLAGIAAAFYFSLRTGNNGYRRGPRRPGRAGPSRADRQHGSGGGAPVKDWAANDLPAADDPWTVNDHRAADKHGPGNAGRAANAGRASSAGRPATHASANYRDEARTGPNTVMDLGREPGLVSGPAPLSSPTPLDAFGPPAAKPGGRVAARLGRGGRASVDPADLVDPDLSDPEALEDLDAEAGPQKAAKSRRRMGWRKGSEIDEEMWPAESFGGLSDDQFWEDLASDKPLTTTARSAHQDSGAHRNSGPKDQPEAKEQLTDAAARPADRARGNGRRPAHGAGHTPGHPGARPRAAGQPAPQIPQLSPVPAATRPAPAQPAPAQLQPTTQPGGSARQFPAGSSQPMRAATGPHETHGRRQAGAGEDPLTSSAFSLRASGPVNGWSNQAPSGPQETSREPSWDQYNAAVSQGTETQAFSTVDTQAASGGYPGGVSPYRPSGPPPGSHTQAQRSDGGWSREGGADPYSGTTDPYSGTSAYLYPGRPSSEQRPYGEGQPYDGNRSRRGPATGNAPTPPPNSLPYDDPYADAPADEPRQPNGAGARPGTQPPRTGYQGPVVSGEDRRRPRDPRDGYRR